MSRRDHFDAGHGREEYRGFVEGRNLEPLLPDGSAPEYLYRSVHPDEWKAAQESGVLRSHGHDRGAGRIFATREPGDYASPDRMTLRIRYAPEDGWKTRVAGDTITAVTDQVALDRVEVYKHGQ